MISAALTESGQLPSGDSIDDFWREVADYDLLAVGINCSPASPVLESQLERLSSLATTFVSCHPSAGIPGPGGDYPDTPAALASVLAEWAGRGWLNVAGGCCGTGPEHIRRIGLRVRSRPASPRKRPPAGAGSP